MPNAATLGFIIAGSLMLATSAVAQETVSLAVAQPKDVNAKIARALAREPRKGGITSAEHARPSVLTKSGCPAVEETSVSKMVRAVAVEEGVDPDLADAVAWVESQHGAARKTSSAGAMGIMQLMPDTASDLGVADRCDVEANIRGGVKYLKKLYSEFGDPLLMLAAYNAGPGNVYKKQGIPEFDETTKYVVKVLNRWKLSAMVSPKQTAKVTGSNGEGNGENAWKDGHVIEVQ